MEDRNVMLESLRRIDSAAEEAKTDRRTLGRKIRDYEKRRAALLHLLADVETAEAAQKSPRVVDGGRERREDRNASATITRPDDIVNKFADMLARKWTAWLDEEGFNR